MPRWLGLIQLVLLGTLAGALLAIPLAELTLRASGWRLPGIYDAEGRLVEGRVAGPEGGSQPPNLDGFLYHFDYHVPWKVNRHGFRERDPHPKRAGTWRVGLIGDSNVAGFGVERSERFGERWIAEVRGQVPQAEMWSLGAGGSGTHHVADVLAGVGSEYELDEIVLAVSAVNELRYNVNWYRQRDAIDPEVWPEGVDRESIERPTAGDSGGIKSWLRRSRLAMFLWFNAAQGLFQNEDSPFSRSLASVPEQWPFTEKALAHFADAVGGRPWALLYVSALAPRMRRRGVAAGPRLVGTRRRPAEGRAAGTLPSMGRPQ